MALAIITALAWASLTRVDEITRADARVVPDGREQVIASLEGGILRELQVREGMQVEEGQDLAQIDPTRFETQQNEGQAKRLALKATIARLAAEATGSALKFPADVAALPDMVAGETASYQARRRSVEEAVGSTHRSVALLQRELDVAQRMSDQGPDVQRRSDPPAPPGQRPGTAGARANVNRFRQDASTDLVRVQTEMAQVNEQMTGRADVLRRTVLKSPVRGPREEHPHRNNRRRDRAGRAGDGDRADRQPHPDRGAHQAVVDRLRACRPASVEVKLSAYDFTTYGGLKGTIETISPDALGDTERAASSDATYYRALVRAEPSTMRSHGKPLPVMPA